MITFIILGIVAILAVAFIMMAWNSGKRKRSNQSEVTSESAAAGRPKIDRASGPD